MCADKASDLFHCPVYKLMISDLKNAVQKTDPVPDIDDHQWHLRITRIPDHLGRMVALESLDEKKPFLDLDLKLVWIQGTVQSFQKVNNDSENMSVVITDNLEETDKAVLYEYLTVPGGDHDSIKIGSYVGALGEIWSITDEVVFIKAAKIMYLGDKPMLKALWTDEVRLNKAFLAGLISPVIF